MRQVAKIGLLTAVATGSVLASTAGYAYAAGSSAEGTTANSPGVASGNSVQAPIDLPVNACGNTVNVIGLLNPAYGNHCGNTTGGGSGTGSGGTDQGGSSGGSTSGQGGSSSGQGGSTRGGGSSASGGGSSAQGTTSGSPGVGSGNSVQAPVNAPVNACGNTVNVVGLGNPAFGNECGNHQPPTTQPPGDNCPPPDDSSCPPPSETPPGGDTGSTGGSTGSTGGGTRSGTPSGDVPGSQTGVTAVAASAAQPVAHATPANSRLASTGADGLELLAPTGALLLIGGGVLYRRSRAMAR